MSKWLETLTLRDRMTLAYETKTNEGQACFDISQSLGWCGRGTAEVLPCLIPKHKVFMAKPPAEHIPRQVLGKESLMLHGFPKFILESERLASVGLLSDSFLKDLAGNSFQVFAFQALLASTPANLPVNASDPDQNPPGDESDLDSDALSAVLGM